MSNLMPTYKPATICFVRGEGVHLFDEQGRQYLDFVAGIAVTSLGHAHPAVADAIANQARTLLHVSNQFDTKINEEVAGELDRLIGNGTRLGGKVFFCNSGAEANECAIKLARRVGGRGRYAVVSAYGSFHGRTLATLHATGQPAKHEPFAPLPEGFRHVAYGDIEALSVAADPGVVAGLLFEVIEGEGGVVSAPPGYLRTAREICDERGILLIIDEVQTGLGRTGNWFAFQHEGIVPDIVTMAKALGNGMPVGACWARGDIADVFSPGDHATTFGGQPLAMSAVRATLATMVELDIPELARTTGSYLKQELEEVSGIAAVRGRGLLLGVVLEQGIDAGSVVAHGLRHGLVLNATSPDVIRLAPALILSKSDCDEATEKLARAIDDARPREEEKR